METEFFDGQEEFETLFPVPDGVFYDPESGEYDCEQGPFYSAALKQQGKLEAWLVLRDMLPEIDDDADDDDHPVTPSGVLLGFPFMVGELVTCVETILTMIEMAEGKVGAPDVAVDPMQEIVISQLPTGTIVDGQPVRYSAYFSANPADTWPVLPIPSDKLHMDGQEGAKTH